VEAIRVRYGLDKPVINCFQQLNPLELGDCLVNPLETQFFIYAGNLLRGELGISYHSNRPVWDVLLERLWNTVLLVVAGQVLAIVIGIALGVLASWKVRTGLDYGALGGQPGGLEPADLLAGHHPALHRQPALWTAHRRQNDTRHGLRYSVGAGAGPVAPHDPAYPDLHHRLYRRVHADHAQHHAGCAL
jgi:hypothetical protein